MVGGATTTSLRWAGVLLLELSLTSAVDRRCLYRRIKLDDPEAVLLLVVIPPQSSSFSWVASPLCHFLEPKQPIPPHPSTGRPCHRYHCRRTAPSIRLSCARCWRKGGWRGTLPLQSVSGHIEWVATLPRVAFMSAVVVTRLGCGGCR